MRNRPDEPVWAGYIRAAREQSGKTRPELAQAIGVGRTTVWRWERGEQVPDDAQIVVRFADVLGLDLDEALAAAGLRPHVPAPSQPRRQELPMDPDVLYLLRRLADPDVPGREKRWIRTQLRHLRDLADLLDQRDEPGDEHRQAS